MGQTKRGRCWRTQSTRSTTTTPAGSALRSSIGALPPHFLQRKSPDLKCASAVRALVLWSARRPGARLLCW